VYDTWRSDWIKRGCPWFSSGEAAPVGWDPQEQLRNWDLRRVLWNRVSVAFDECARMVMRERPQAVITSGHWGNALQPFWAWLSIARPSEEDIVLSVSVERKSDSYSLRADLMVEQGPLLSEMQNREISAAASGQAFDTALAEAEKYIRDQPRRIAAML
jgi:hypothetical protein